MTGQLQLPEPAQGVVNPAAGEAAKRRGTRRIGQLDPKWSTDCDEAIEAMAARGVVFQAADLIREGLVDEPPHPNCWGPRFIRASKRGVIEHVKFDGSGRATVHRSICHHWIGTAAYREARAAA
jgi:hypothetical protein